MISNDNYISIVKPNNNIKKMKKSEKLKDIDYEIPGFSQYKSFNNTYNLRSVVYRKNAYTKN